jgi:iron complex transport system substrate-binding protein
LPIIHQYKISIFFLFFPVITFLFCPTDSLATDSLEIQVIDDAKRSVVLDQPAQKIISLSPHITELIYSAGAGDKLIGVDDYSNYPEAAKSITRIGDANHLDIEKILSLQPDLIVAWGSGQSHDQFIEQLMHLNLTVYISSPEDMEAIPHTVENLGKLAGTYDYAKHQSQNFRDELMDIISEYSEQPSVTVFYEIWNQPLFTINGQHVMSKVIEICGGRNVFADLSILSPEVNIEAVISTNPDVIIASGVVSGSGNGDQRPPWLDDWLQWPTINAARNNHLYHIPPDLIHRQTFRILQGTRILCEQLQSAR